MPPEVLLLYRIVLAILGFLFFHIKLIIVLSRSVKNFVGILMGIVLNLLIAFGRISIFTMLILPIQEHGRFFHFLVERIFLYRPGRSKTLGLPDSTFHTLRLQVYVTIVCLCFEC